MSLRRAVGSLLTGTAPARSLHSSFRNHGRLGAAALAAAAFAAAGGTLAVHYFNKGPDENETVAPKEEEDLKARFEDWAKEYDRTYRDEEEKAMRFQVFKDTINWIESQPPHKFRKLNGFADRKQEEFCTGISGFDLDPDTIEHNKKLNEWLARNDKGERFFWPPELQAEKDKEANQASA